MMTATSFVQQCVADIKDGCTFHGIQRRRSLAVRHFGKTYASVLYRRALAIVTKEL